MARPGAGAPDLAPGVPERRPLPRDPQLDETPGPMIEIMRTNDIVLISVVSSILEESRIAYFVADQHMSVIEGSSGFLARRVMVERDAEARARRLLTEAGFGEELRHG